MRNPIENISKNKGKLLLLADQGLVSGVNFTNGILLARFLGLDEYGMFALAWMTVLFVSSLHKAFIISPLYALLPKQTDKDAYRASLLFIQIGFSTLSLILVFALSEISFRFYPEWCRPYLSILLACAAAIFSLQDYLRRLFFSSNRPSTVLILDVLAYGLQPILILALHHFSRLNLTTAFASIITVFLASVFLGLSIIRKRRIDARMVFAVLRRHWVFSKFLIGTALLQWVSGNLFIAVAGGILGPIAVGAIRIAQNVVGVLHVLFLAMENLVPVQASELLHSEGKRPMLAYIGSITKQAAIPTLLLLTIISIFRGEIINLLYGAEYLQFNGVLLAFCLLYVLVFIGTILRFVIVTLENNQTIFISYVVSSIFSLILAKPFVTQFGVVGVMAGLFAMQFLTLSIYLFTLKRDLQWLFK